MSNRLSLSGVLVAVFLAGLVPLGGQQPPTATPPPAGGRGGGRGAVVRSPEVTPDQRVTFRLRAPNAKEVAVSFGRNTRPMQRDDQGVWTVTTDPLQPDIYTYSLVVDGTSLNDPANRQVQTSWNGHTSMFVVPGADPWFPKAGVPRGAIARHRFTSTIAGDEREFFVYTPAGYDPRRSRRYPVLFLQHGLGDDAERWMNGGAAPAILDNLIAEGKAVPMVVVTTLGYGTSQGPTAPSGAIVTGFERILTTEVLPLVERSYHVSRNREERGIAGLSMGGAESLYTVFNNLDTFAWVGSFSGAFVMWPRSGAAAVTPAALDQLFPAVSARLNAQLKLIWISCGTADSLLGVNRTVKEWLRSKNVKFHEEEAEGIGHVWPLWRQDFSNFAQRVFK
jgi:enterochelin esterase-like enzyme